MIQIRPRIVGAGRIVHRCADCGQPITDGEPVLEHRDGRLVARHKEHDRWPQTHG